MCISRRATGDDRDISAPFFGCIGQKNIVKAIRIRKKWQVKVFSSPPADEVAGR